MSLIIWHRSYLMVKYIFSDYMKVPKSPEEVEHSAFLFHGFSNSFQIHGFSQCLGAIDRMHIEVIEPEHH